MNRYSLWNKDACVYLLVTAIKKLSLSFLILALAFLGGYGLLQFGTSQLLSFLDDLALEACGGEFVFEQLDYSLSEPYVEARNAAIVVGGKRVIEVGSLRASIRYRPLLQQKVLLTIEIKGGKLLGVGRESGIFKLIDNLTDESPDDSGWDVLLMRLVVDDVEVEDDTQGALVQGTHVRVLMTREGEKIFHLNGSAPEGSITFHNAAQSKIALGPLETNLIINAKENFILFERFRLPASNSLVELTGRMGLKGKKEIVFSGTSHLESALLGEELSEVVKMNLDAAVNVTGDIHNPNLTLGFYLPVGTKGEIALSKEHPLGIGSIQGEFYAAMVKDQVSMKLNSLRADTSEGLLTITNPISLDKGLLSGSARLNLDQLFVDEDLSLEGLQVEASLRGQLLNPEAELSGTVSKIKYGELFASPLNCTGTLRNLSISSRCDAGSSQGIKIETNGVVSWEQELSPFLKELTFKVGEVSLSPKRKISEIGNPGSGDDSPSLTLQGQGSVSGPLDLSRLEGKAEITGSFTLGERRESFLAQASLHAGQGLLSLSNASDTIRGRAVLPLNREPLLVESSLEFRKLEPSLYYPKAKCAQVSSLLKYNFALAEPLKGRGDLAVSSLEIGCSPYTVVLTQPQGFLIKDGTLSITNTKLKNNAQELDVSATISPRGKSEAVVSAVLNAELGLPFVPWADDLDGSIDAQLNLSYYKGNLDILGKASLRNGSIFVESADIGIQDISLDLTFVPDLIHIERGKAQFGSGYAQLSGDIDLNTLENSQAALTFNSLEFAPVPNAQIITSGNLALNFGENRRARLAGEIQIDRAELRQDFGAREILLAVQEAILPAKEIGASAKKQALPLDLDLKVKSDRNIFVISNWGAAELKADLSITGPLASASAKGQMETLSGWVIASGRRYWITSGQVTFDPVFSGPRLSILAETTVKTAYGEILFVTLEVSGRVSNPKITITSNSNYSEAELLDLLASSQDLEKKDEGSLLPIQIWAESDTFEGEDKSLFDDVQYLLKTLTQIDSLEISPSYNEVTGVIEPTIRARRRLSDLMSVSLEQFVGQTESKASVALAYELTPKTTVQATAGQATAQKSASFGGLVSYEVLTDTLESLKAEIIGNENLKASAIREALRIKSRSSIARESLNRLTSELKSFYQDNGFRNTQVSVSCKEDRDPCRDLLIQIQEGPQTLISNFSFVNGARETTNNVASAFSNGLEKNIGLPASNKTLVDIRASLLERARRSGFLSATMDVSLKGTDEPLKEEVYIKADLGTKYIFDFVGNTRFSSDELLERNGVTKRKQPWGRNSFSIFLSDLEQLYKASGCHAVSIEGSTDAQVDTGTTAYRVSISEGICTRVVEVKLIGNNSLSESSLRQLVLNRGKSLETQVFSPTYLIETDLAEASQVLKEIYKEEGYPDAEVTFEISPAGEDTVSVDYRIKEGAGKFVYDISVNGLPQDLLRVPREPKTPLPTDKVEAYANRLLKVLRDNGYLKGSITRSLSDDARSLRFEVEPGVQTHISSIVIEGREYTLEDMIRKNLSVREGDAWKTRSLVETRQRLLKTGLFSRVELVPADGALDQEEEVLLVKLSERNLETLSVGGGYDSENGFRFFSEGVDRKFFLDGRTIDFRLDGYYDLKTNDINEGLAKLRYTNPHFLEDTFRLTEDLRLLRLHNANLPYDTNRISLLSYLDRKFGTDTNLDFGHTISFENLNNVKPDAILGPLDTGALRISFLSAQALYTDYDNILSPQKGWKFGTQAKLANELIGSDASFTTLGADGAFLLPLPFSDRLAIADSLRSAASFPQGGSNVIPITQRFFLGGASSVRGYSENSLGPKGADGSMTGGDLTFLNNLELRLRIYEDFSLHGFIDSGNVFLQDETVDLRDLKSSIGTGLRYLSPIGPIGFDLGFPIDSDDAGQEYALHFRVGTQY